MPSPTRVCCRPQSSHSTPCLSPGWPCPMSPVSRRLGSGRPGLLPRLGTFKDVRDPSPRPFQDSVLLGVGRTPSFLELSLLFCLSAVARTWTVGCVPVCPSEPIFWAPWLLRPGLRGLRVTMLPSPDQKCNPHLLTHFGNGTVLAGPEGYETHWWDAPSIVGLVVFILCTVFIR